MLLERSNFIARLITILLFISTPFGTCYAQTLFKFSEAKYQPGDYLARLGRFSANGISADGATVIGNIIEDAFIIDAYFWTPDRGLEPLELGRPSYSQVRDVSGDGDVFVGAYDRGPGETGEFGGFRWTSDDGLLDLGSLRGTSGHSDANAISDDGKVIVGSSSSDVGTQAFRWTEQGGMEGLGFIDVAGSRPRSTALGISGDGRVIVGSSTTSHVYVNGNYSQVSSHAFRWDRGSGMQQIVPGGGRFIESAAWDASHDGKVVVGTVSEFRYEERPDPSRLAPRNHTAFRWTRAGGLQLLGRLSIKDTYSSANAVSGDGSKIVGSSGSIQPFRLEAFLWTEEGGMERLSEVLEAAGIDMTGIILTSANGISADGETIVGRLRQGSVRDSFLAILTPDGLAGLLGATDFAASVEGISEVGSSTAALALRGAGDMMFVANSFQPDAKPVDVASLDWTGLGNDLSFRAFTLGQGLLGLTEDGEGVSGAIGLMGGSQDLGLSAGLALQGQYVGQTGGLNDSTAESSGTGPTAFVRYAPGDEGVSLTLTGNYHFLDADTERRYRNGAAIDTAVGNTDGFSFGGEFQAGWRFGFGDDVTAMPYLSYHAQHAQLDAYNETGAAFAGSMSEQDTTIRKAKIGALGAWQISEAFALTGGVEFAYVDEDVSHAGLNVAALGTGTFGGTGGSRDYGVTTLGIGGAYDVNERIRIFGSVDVTKALSSEADDQDIIGGRLGVSVALF